MELLEDEERVEGWEGEGGEDAEDGEDGGEVGDGDSDESRVEGDEIEGGGLVGRGMWGVVDGGAGRRANDGGIGYGWSMVETEGDEDEVAECGDRANGLR